MYSKHMYIGRLGADPEMAYSQEGEPRTTFRLAVDVGYGDNKRTDWVRVTVWGKQAESVNAYCKKGAKVLVEGNDLSPYAFIDKDSGEARATLQLTARDVRFLDSRKDADASADSAPAEDFSKIPF